MNNPKITIITAAYNLIDEGREKTFRQCLEQVHNQTYKNIEHLIIFTPSTDKTEELISEYVEKGWVTCHVMPTKGLWEAMQSGFKIATGDFINFMNSDDYFSDAQAIELIASALVEENADYAFADAVGIKENGEESYWKADIELVPFGQCMCHQTLFVSMNFMREVGGFDFNYGPSLDNHMMLKLQIMNKKHAYIPKPLVCYRYGGWSSQLDTLKIKEDYALNFYDQIGKEYGLNLDECKNLWCLNFINDKDEKYCRKIARKINNEKWEQTILNKLQQKIYSEKVYRYFIFKFIPIIKREQNASRDKIKYYLLNFIPILKIRINNNLKTKKYYLFSFIPIYKMSLNVEQNLLANSK